MSPVASDRGNSDRGTTSATSTSKQGANGKMHLDSEYLVVRKLESSTGLEGAFRVHVLPESLEKAGLKIGDLCTIASEDGTTGYGFAWRADDNMGTRPKNRPAKMTQTFRNAFGFEEGSRVTVEKTDARILHATRIVLSDVTPPEFNKAGAKDDGCWKARVNGLFANCEALATGISFDMVSKKKHYRKRFCIESVELREAQSPDVPNVFAFNDNTELVFPDLPEVDLSTANGISRISSPQPSRSVSYAVQPQYRLNTDHIGGLIEQCRKLNRRLQRVLDTSRSLRPTTNLRPNPAVLLHGYEGTGKTTILHALAKSGFTNVVRLDRAKLNGGSVVKNQAIIEQMFDSAEAAQPSLLLLDNLQALAPADDIAYSEAIAHRMKALYDRDHRVMIVGATRNLSEVKSDLLNHECFSQLVELPIPDLAAREQILNILRHKPAFARDSLSSYIAGRTHGFTARDVAALYDRAATHAYDRYEEEREVAELARSPLPPTYQEVQIHLNGTSTLPPPDPTNSEDPRADALIEDFELALQEIRPTALREVFTEKPNIRWSDIGGSGRVKRSFDEIIGWPLQHKELLQKYQYQPPKGVLLYGPPGCSKTLTAQAVANTYNFNFIAIKGAELLSMYVGESERQVREVFRKAKAAAPCVIFFDEIDSIGTERDSTGTKGLNVLTTLLNEMDGFDTLRDVFILAATNKPETLDSALMRPGRFDSHVYLGPPDAAARKEILSIATKGVSLSGDVNFDSLVTATQGYSGAEIVRICQSAKEPTIRRQIANLGEDIRISQWDFEVALERTKKGITKEMLEGYEAFARRSEE